MSHKPHGLSFDERPYRKESIRIVTNDGESTGWSFTTMTIACLLPTAAAIIVRWIIG